MRYRRGFSLLELLVVISVILVLAAVLYPVFGSAKEAAKQTKCISNLHQLALAVQMYRTQSGAESEAGDVYAMGLPPQPIHASLPISRQLGQCAGPNRMPLLAPTGFPYWYTVPPPGQMTADGLTWGDYVSKVGDQAILFMDTNHNPAGTSIDATSVTKRVIAACLDGHVVDRVKAGNPWMFIDYWR